VVFQTTNTQFTQQLVFPAQGNVLVRAFLVVAMRNPVHALLGPQIQPCLPTALVQQTSFVVDELLHFADGFQAQRHRGDLIHADVKINIKQHKNSPWLGQQPA
jgi:hypothetical protein